MAHATAARSPRSGAARPHASHVHGVIDQATQGQAGALPHRAHLQGVFGSELQDVHAYFARPALVHSVGAEALSRGNDVVFSTPNPSVAVAAHEVAHVLQRQHQGSNQAGVTSAGDHAERDATRAAESASRGEPAVVDASLARTHAAASPRPHLEAPTEVRDRYRAFIRGVYAAARSIVTSNVRAVEQWRAYVMEALPPSVMEGQVFATGFEELRATAQAHGMTSLLPRYANEHNPVRQELLEHQMQGEWLACTSCHVSNIAWGVDGEMAMRGDIGQTPAELMGSYAGLPPLSSARRRRERLEETWGSAPPIGDISDWAALFPLNPQGSHGTPSSAAPLGWSGASPPTPPAHEIAVDTDWQALAVLDESVARIGPELQVLGSGGYDILPDHVISRFGQLPRSELRAALDRNFQRRLDGYASLLSSIDSQSIDYLEFDTLLAALKPLAAEDVRALVTADERADARRKAFMAVGLFVIDLLSIVFPPLGLAAGLLHVAHGVHQMGVGVDRSNATGLHGLMSPGRQASGDMMVAMGALEVLGGALQAGMTASGLLRANPGGGALARTGGRSVTSQTQGPVTIEVMANGSMRVTHAAHPGRMIVAQRNGSFQAFDELGNVVGSGNLNFGGAGASGPGGWSAGSSGGGSAMVPYGGSTGLAPVGPTALAPAPPLALPAAQAPLMLGPGNPTTLSLRQLRNLRGPQRWQGAEQYAQELYGSTGQQHFPVPANPNAARPITGTGGRHVDAPVTMESGQIFAGEVKMYQRWTTIRGQPVRRDVPLSTHIEQQIHKDMWLRDNVPGYDPRWMFLDAPPSPGLIDKLRDANITWIQY